VTDDLKEQTPEEKRKRAWAEVVKWHNFLVDRGHGSKEEPE